MENINDSYFDGIYKDLWRSIIPQALTEKEVRFIISYFNLKPGDSVLDLMCGFGRHTLALAREGINVTAVDNLDPYISEIKDIVQKEQLPVTTYCEDVLIFQAIRKFDLVICMGNSINFYNKTDTIALLAKIKEALKPGGSLLLNSWSLAEIVLDSFKEESRGLVNGVMCTTRSRRFFNPLRIESQTTFETDSGTKETKIAIDYIFTLPEMENMLNQAGMKLLKVYSIPNKKEFSRGDLRAYLIAM